MLYWLVRYIALFSCKLFFNIKVFGQEHIPKTGPVIIASNHLSYLDPIAISVSSPRKLNFLAKSELFKNRLWGKFLQSIGVFSLKRKGESDIAAIKESLKRLKENKALLVFPEGTRSPDGSLKKGLAGVGMIALKANCPVIPAFIKGSDSALPLKAKFIRLRPISVYFGRSITPPEIYNKDTYRKLSDKIMEEIAKLGGFYN